MNTYDRRQIDLLIKFILALTLQFNSGCIQNTQPQVELSTNQIELGEIIVGAEVPFEIEISSSVPNVTLKRVITSCSCIEVLPHVEGVNISQNSVTLSFVVKTEGQAGDGRQAIRIVVENSLGEVSVADAWVYYRVRTPPRVILSTGFASRFHNESEYRLEGIVSVLRGKTSPEVTQKELLNFSDFRGFACTLMEREGVPIASGDVIDERFKFLLALDASCERPSRIIFGVDPDRIVEVEINYRTLSPLLAEPASMFAGRLQSGEAVEKTFTICNQTIQPVEITCLSISGDGPIVFSESTPLRILGGTTCDLVFSIKNDGTSGRRSAKVVMSTDDERIEPLSIPISWINN